MQIFNKNDVIVIGAGPVGLTMACELRLAGLDVTVLERRAKPVSQSRSLTMHGRTLEMLALRGIADRFMARGMKIPSGHFASLPTRLDFAVIDTTFPYTLFIPQSLTEQLLEAWALELGVHVLRATTAEQIEETPEGVRVIAKRDAKLLHLSAAYLIGADGARSMVRTHAGIPFEGLPPSHTVMMGDVALASPPATKALSLDGAAGGLMMVPMGGDLFRVIVVDPARVKIPTSVAVTLDELMESTRRVAGADFGMHSPQWLSRFSNETRLVDTYRRGRIFLAGDAAHIHFPAGGQGMNVGMQDAMNLGWKLAGVIKGFGPGSLLDSYHTERHAVGAKLFHNTLAQSALLLNCFDPAGQALRQAMSEYLKIPALNAVLAHDLSAFGIVYPAALSEQVTGWTRQTAWTGRRVPDWRLQLGNGGESSLFALLRGGQWLLLRLTARGAGFVPHVHQEWLRVVEAFPADRADEMAGIDALLIRPDGYVDQAVSMGASTP